MRIAVIGAGIAGLVAACGLQRDGHEVIVYEQRDHPGADGAGLTLFGNAFDALTAVGLSETVKSVSSGAIATMHAGQRAPDGSWLLTLPRASVATLRSAHRVALHNALVAQLAADTLRSGTTAHVATNGAPNISTHGVSEEFDLVIVADGLRSKNRERLGLETGLSYAGYTAWRGVTTTPVEIDNAAGETWGRGAIFGIVPLPDNRLYWFGTLTTEADRVFADERQVVHDIFGAWHAPIPACLAATPAENIMRHDVYELAKPLASFTLGRTALLGDAAHAMTPNLGQGAGQGIEDAVTLTMLLRGVDGNDLGGVLERYSKLRRQRTTALWRQSRWMGRIAQASGPLTAGIRDFGMRMTPGRIAGLASHQLQSWNQPG
ncbi:FAD-dependent oxidoreductase [Yaniella halotolerans]|uniref:FAD-dependent oxidoreductase n=1 Tax=Yaniella halotolerans TaxID=225453 RepID=UPI0003B35B55|nr:FAD-dependent oxidoreductase [Yaniella halotolerans]